MEELTFEEIQKLRQWEENRPENWNPYDDDLVNDTIEHQFGGYDVVKVAKAQGKEDEKGGTWLQGSVRRIRYQKGSKRPPIIWPEIWKLASLADRTKYRRLWARALLEEMALRENSDPARTNSHVHPRPKAAPDDSSQRSLDFLDEIGGLAEARPLSHPYWM